MQEGIGITCDMDHSKTSRLVARSCRAEYLLCGVSLHDLEQCHLQLHAVRMDHHAP